MSYLCVGAVPVQWDWLNSALSPVVYGDIALSINTYKKKKKKVKVQKALTHSNMIYARVHYTHILMFLFTFFQS